MRRLDNGEPLGKKVWGSAYCVEPAFRILLSSFGARPPGDPMVQNLLSPTGLIPNASFGVLNLLYLATVEFSSWARGVRMVLPFLAGM